MMNSITLSAEVFPSLNGAVRAQWAPILLSPIEGSVERLVIGVAVANGSGFFIEHANALDRLRCFYGDEAEGAIFAAVVALEHLQREFSLRGSQVFAASNTPLANVKLGSVRDAEGRSLQEIAVSWMKATSSLYRADQPAENDEYMSPDVISSGYDGIDKLPRLVMDLVTRQDASFARFFRQDLVGAQRRRKSHEITIDFAGSRLVANFGALQPGSVAKSVDHIKRRLWDLKVERDRDAGAFLNREHEMIVQMPSSDDSLFTARQHASLMEAHHALETQADQEDLRLRPLRTVAEIAQRVIAAETARPA